jgi:hypothetical protein
MKCPNEGFVQSYVDCEVDLKEKNIFEEHLKLCYKCRNKVNEAKKNDEFIYSKVKKYKDYMENLYVMENEFLEENKFNTKNGRLKNMVIKYKRLVAMISIAILVSLSLTFQPVRAAISNALMVFRADDINTISIADDEILEIRKQIESGVGEVDLKGLGELNVSLGDEKVITYDDLSEINDIEILLPEDLDEDNLQITSFESDIVNFRFDVEKVNNILSIYNSEELLPDSIDNKLVTLNYGKGIAISYTNNNFLYNIMEMKLPEVEVEEGVDVDKLHDIIISLPIIPESLKTELKSIDDWKNTAYIPVQEGNMEETKVNGNKAYYYVSNESSNENVLVWSENRMIYILSSKDDINNIMKIAENMR